MRKIHETIPEITADPDSDTDHADVIDGGRLFLSAAEPISMGMRISPS
jgi:hypothetical protein